MAKLLITSLPTEILDMIIEETKNSIPVWEGYERRSLLRQLCLVNQEFRAVTLRHLYQNISITILFDQSSAWRHRKRYQLTRQIPLLQRSLRSKDQLKSYIRHLAIEFHPIRHEPVTARNGPGSPEIYNVLDDLVWRHFLAFLNSLVSVKSLKLKIDSIPARYLPIVLNVIQNSPQISSLDLSSYLPIPAPILVHAIKPLNHLISIKLANNTNYMSINSLAHDLNVSAYDSDIIQLPIQTLWINSHRSYIDYGQFIRGCHGLRTLHWYQHGFKWDVNTETNLENILKSKRSTLRNLSLMLCSTNCFIPASLINSLNLTTLWLRDCMFERSLTGMDLYQVLFTETLQTLTWQVVAQARDVATVSECLDIIHSHGSAIPLRRIELSFSMWEDASKMKALQQEFLSHQNRLLSIGVDAKLEIF